MKVIAFLIVLIGFFLNTNAGAAEGKVHFPGVFLGYTNFDDENDFTFGIEYEYKLNKQWGIGGVYERINDAHSRDGVAIVAGMVFWHPIKHWKLGLGFGQERIGGSYQKNKDLVRVSAAYEYYWSDSLEVVPTFSIDRIDGETAYVAGVAFIFPF